MSKNVDFEIAFASLLATLSAYLSVDAFAYEWVVEGAAISLLILTLLRRVGLMNRLENNHPVFFITTYVMTGISYVVAFYLIFWIAELIEGLIPIAVLWIFIVSTPAIVLGLVIAHEIAVGGFMSEAEDAFRSVSIEHRGSRSGVVFEHFSDTARQSRTDRNSSLKQTRLTDYKNSKPLEEATPEELRAVLMHRLGTTIGLLVPFFVYAVLGVALAFWTGSSMLISILLVVCYLAITGLIDVWFSGYGLVQLGETDGKYKAAVIIIGIVFCFHSLPL
jgi:hypothetical protein